MKPTFKKLYLLIFVVLIAFTTLLILQIQKTIEMDTKNSERPLIEDVSLDIPVTPNDPVFGNQGATITIIEFIDLNNKENLVIHQKIKNFVAEHPTEIRLIWKDDPKQSFFSADKNKIHRAGICVFAQNKTTFWSFVDEVATNKKINDTKLSEMLNRYVSDQTASANCFTNPDTEKKITDNLTFIKSIGLPDAPLIFINNKLVNYIDEINITDLLEQIITPLPGN
jgi:protein-disulfide isomerase